MSIRSLRWPKILFLTSLLFAFFIFLFFVINFDINLNIPTERKISLNQGWFIKAEDNWIPLNGDMKNQKFENKFINLKTTLPEIKNGDFLVYSTPKIKAHVYIEDNLIYSQGYNSYKPLNLTKRTILHLIQLDPKHSNKTVEFSFSPQSDINDFVIPDFVIAQKSDVFNDLFSQSALDLFVSVFLFLCFLGFVVYSLRSKEKNNINRGLYLSLFFFLATIWILSDLPLFHMLFGHTFIVTFVFLVSYILMPIPLNLYVQTFTKKSSKLLNGVSILHSLYVIVIIALFVLNLVDLTSINFLTHIVFLLSVSTLVYFTYKNKKLFHYKYMFFTMQLTLHFGVLAVLTYVFLPFSPYYRYIFYCSIISIVISLITYVFKSTKLLQKVAQDAVSYQRQAYLDSLTKSLNRTAFERDIRPLSKLKTSSTALGILMIDINDLKYVNDNFGHNAGDIYIKAVSHCINSVVLKSGSVYRIGGDEFVVLFKGEHANESFIVEIISKIRKTLNQYEFPFKVNSDIAVGFAIKNSEENETLTYHELYCLADSKMYKDKAISKGFTSSSSMFDSLTGIYNKKVFLIKVRQVLDDESTTNKYAIIDFDINRFENINTFFSRKIGDDLLVKTAKSIQTLLKENEFCARASGDKFLVFVESSRAIPLIKQIKESFEKTSVLIQNHTIFPSFGVYIIKDTQLSTDQMCDLARVAKRMVKGDYMNYYAIYDEQLHEKQVEDTSLVSYFITAIKNGEIVPYYQPQFDIETKKPVGAEALTRWIEPSGNIIMPTRFVGVLENAGMITTLDIFVLRCVCKMLATRIKNFETVLPISVNFSRLSLRNPKFADIIINIADEYSIPHNLIIIELTETIFIADPHVVGDFVKKMNDAYFLLSLDDFGSGFSSLHLLQNIHIDQIKIDQSLIKGCDSSNPNPLLEATLYYAKLINAKIVAEGIQKEEQLAYLSNKGCDIVQGYLLAEPMEKDSFLEFLNNLN